MSFNTVKEHASWMIEFMPKQPFGNFLDLL